MKNYTKTISHLNGNKQKYTLEIPQLWIQKFGNEIAKEWFIKQTGLELKDYAGGYIAQPKTFKQLYKVFATYNWKTTFFNNASWKNTLKLQHNLETFNLN